MALADPIRARDQRPLVPLVDEMTFADVAGTLRRRWYVPAIAMLTCLAGALLYDFLATSIYRAETVVAPAAETRGGGGSLSSVAGELSGLASLAGVSLSSLSGSETQTQVAVATLQSRALVEEYIKENRLLPVLFASKWDASRGMWKVKQESKRPTLWDASELFLNKIEKVDFDRLTGLLTLSVEWKNPALAAKWANGLIELTNARLRQIAISQAETNIRYLQGVQKKTTDVAMSNAISRLLEEQLSDEMLAQGNQEFAFNVIDPAVSPGKREWPRRRLLAVGGAFGGLLIGVLIALLPMDRWRGAAQKH